MLYREIIAVCSEIHTKHIQTLCGQNVEFVSVKLVIHNVTAGRWVQLMAQIQYFYKHVHRDIVSPYSARSSIIVYLFVVYLATESVVQIIWLLMFGG